MSELHVALDQLRRGLCHCGLRGECLGCKGIEMLRAQAEAVVAAASQPVLLQVAQEAAMKDMATQFEGMAQRLLDDPELRRDRHEHHAGGRRGHPRHREHLIERHDREVHDR